MDLALEMDRKPADAAGCCCGMAGELKELERQIAKDLLSIGAVFLRPGEPFTWASGIKSPIYCDNRLTLTAPRVRDHTLLDLPMGYVRSSAKDHGRTNRIEGRLERGQKAVVIEDLISTGDSCIEVVKALREAGAEVLGIASIFTYGMQTGLDHLREAEVRNHSLSNFDTLVEVAAEQGYIRPEDIERLMAFRANPRDESWIGTIR